MQSDVISSWTVMNATLESGGDANWCDRGNEPYTVMGARLEWRRCDLTWFHGQLWVLDLSFLRFIIYFLICSRRYLALLVSNDKFIDYNNWRTRISMWCFSIFFVIDFVCLIFCLSIIAIRRRPCTLAPVDPSAGSRFHLMKEYVWLSSSQISLCEFVW